MVATTPATLLLLPTATQLQDRTVRNSAAAGNDGFQLSVDVVLKHQHLGSTTPEVGFSGRRVDC